MEEVQTDTLTQHTAYVQEILKDYKTCVLSREVSLMGRKEVLTGKAKFGILGDGKEVPQVAMARAFKNGDFRSGYYRDQTFMFAAGLLTVEEYFAQLYADPIRDIASGGRQMNGHYSAPLLDREGNWLAQKDQKNVSADISPTAGQMARALGLALASGLYRKNKALQETPFSNAGNEVCFCTIGDASTSEGVFWETLNAAGVMQVPLAVSVWDDGYGISVPIEFQTVKGSISEALAGFHHEEAGRGVRILKGYAWDYAGLVKLYDEAITRMRSDHQPALFHIKECTQPQGHSTSGSHERYKSPERLQWEQDRDCIQSMRRWIVDNGFATEDELTELEKEAAREAKTGRDNAWKAYQNDQKAYLSEVAGIYDNAAGDDTTWAGEAKKALGSLFNPLLHEIVVHVKSTLRNMGPGESPMRDELKNWLRNVYRDADDWYHSHQMSESSLNALKVPVVAPEYTEDAVSKNGFEILNAYFDQVLTDHPEVYAFGEDVGKIGDVNQGFAGLQAKHGEDRVFDTGIREWTIMGQAIGMAMRGLRPIAEIQYLDYLAYGLIPLTDDLATVQYRSKGQQKAPAIIRTRGHRLEGIWHSGSPMGMIIHSLRGIHVCVPRDMTRAAGFYQTLLQCDEPGIIIECLNGYRLKEKVPANLGVYNIPLGVPEVLTTGTDVSLVTYGSCVRIAQQAVDMLAGFGISVELIDIQTLLPFDLEHRIVQSLMKTNRIVFLDEDVPGGAASFMMQQVLEEQGGYYWLDSSPQTITAREHRSPYGSVGDYFTKPNAEDVFERIYTIMSEADPNRFKPLYF